MGTGASIRESQIVYKAADEGVNTDNTLNDDSTLKIAMGANERWVFELGASVSWDGGGLQVAFNGPAAANNVEYWIEIVRDDATLAEQQGTYDSVAAIAPDIARIGHVRGWCAVDNGANAGEFVFRWCQHTSDADITVVKEGSWLRGTRLA